MLFDLTFQRKFCVIVLDDTTNSILYGAIHDSACDRNVLYADANRLEYRDISASPNVLYNVCTWNPRCLSSLGSDVEKLAELNEV